MKFLFVGERRSDKAIQMKVTWTHGRLAAKQLFDALSQLGLNPKEQAFCNWFERGGKKKTREWNGVIIAMGRKVQRELMKEGVEHKFIFHPAARGSIRRKSNYLKHIKSCLFPILKPRSHERHP